MYGQNELRAHLQQRLGVSDRQMRRLISMKADALPSTKQQALGVLAHESRMRLRDYLTSEQIAEVRALTQGQASVRPSSHGKNGGRDTPTRKASSARTVDISVDTKKFGVIPALKSTHASEAKAMAERVYPLLYIFENSLRDLIEVVLEAKYGKDWWDAAVPTKVQEAAADMRKQEKKDTVHGKRGRRDVDYLLLTHLWKIVNHKWKDFEPLFPPGKHWVQTVIEVEMNVSRRPVAHMNPLEDEDIENVVNTFRQWVRNLQAVADKLPKS